MLALLVVVGRKHVTCVEFLFVLCIVALSLSFFFGIMSNSTLNSDIT